MPSFATRSAESMVNPVPITGTWNRCSAVCMEISSGSTLCGSCAIRFAGTDSAPSPKAAQTLRPGRWRPSLRAKSAPFPLPQFAPRCVAARLPRWYQARVSNRWFASLLFLAALPLRADPSAYGPELEGFDYAYPVQRFDLQSQRQALHMSYLDVRPRQPDGRVVVLLHGKNFCAGTWEATIKALSEAGYRVVAPDQIGFCKSSKPERYQYSFQQLAANTRALLAHLGIERSTVVGHSTGGMLAARYALLYPQQVDQLVLVNPIGLEDWKALGVPWR